MGLAEEIGGERRALLAAYYARVVSYNAEINLTAITSPAAFAVKNVLDSLALLKLPSFAREAGKIRLIDVGTGAGLPGVPLAVCRPHWDITLLDALQKRLAVVGKIAAAIFPQAASESACPPQNFTEQTGGTSSLLPINQKNPAAPRLTYLHARAEEAGKDRQHREKYDIAVARAVAPCAVLAEYLLPLVAVGGGAALMKSGDYQAELDAAKTAIIRLGGEIADIKAFSLPALDGERAERSLITIEKIAPTPPQYPRRAGKIKK